MLLYGWTHASVAPMIEEVADRPICYWITHRWYLQH